MLTHLPVTAAAMNVYSCWLYSFWDFVFFSISLIISALLFLSLLVVTQTRGHIADSSPPSPLRFVPRIFVARRLQRFLPSSTRVECFFKKEKTSQL